ncbi:hypothetical protein [Paenibacillus protaetiae]|uniref:Lipoprotein n=1 Tax=Paenibacillus protaetiae TaxID=2509456 RepID=A0A4P6FA77_9BACL|nr:hypothetical protein [Paenibacillus protaetiae]QAY67398.1 hypothetical protein ET464_14365 [Paenibacillus protaetiae]
MNNKRLFVGLASAALLVLSGCKDSGSAKDALQKAMEHTYSAASYSMQADLTVNQLALPEQQSAQASAIASLLKGGSIHMDAQYEQEPKRTDMNVEVELAAGVKLQLPVIMTEDKLYVKLPSIPLLPLPGTVTGKYIEMDYAAGADAASGASMNPAVTQALVQDASRLLVKDMDAKSFFKNVDMKDASLPDGVKADQVVQFRITPDNQAEAVEAVSDKLLPDLAALLMKHDEYREALHIDKNKLEQWKNSLAADPKGAAGKLNKRLHIEELSVTTAIYKDDLAYQSVIINVQLVNPKTNDTFKLDTQLDLSYSGINEKKPFKEALPSDTIKADQLEQLLKAPAGL